MPRPRPVIALLVAAGLVPGCQGFRGGGGGAKRGDPLLMSHLTHRRDDPSYAETEGEVSREEGETIARPASVSQSKKPPATGGRGHDEDYRWIRGSLTRRGGDGDTAGWYVDYGRGPATDAHGGKLRLLLGSRAGLVREGDAVRVVGRIVVNESGDSLYHVESLTLLD